MPAAALPENEHQRLEKLRGYEILDTDAEAAFDRIAQLAAELCDVEIGLISLIDEDRQWFKARCGLDVAETPREASFCAHAIHRDEVLIVEDATQDARFMDNPLVTGEFHLRFYAGAPLQTSDGYRLGTLCVVDLEPRLLSPLQARQLADLSTLVVDELELRLTVKRLREARDLAAGASTEKSKFISTLSHELRTPLNAILGYAQLLKRNADDTMSERQTRSINQIVDSGNHLATLIDYASEISKIEAGQLKFDLTLTDISELLDDCIGIFRPLASERNITISGPKLEPKFPALHTDATRIKQVVINLLSNALKYNSDGGSISVSTSLGSDGCVRISVSDTGPGVPPESHDTIFEPFERLGAGTLDVDGTGIGLTISRQMITALGGKMGLESEPGRGSTFWIDIPS